MRHTLSRYLMTLLCMLAAGTWILPVHTLAAPAPLPVSEVGEEEAHAAALALRDAIEAMRLAGEFDRAPFAFEGADLTGDDIVDTIQVFPPQRLETPGAIRVLDGATGVERYTLQSPDGEMGFGDHAAVVADCDDDGLPDIAVWSWLDAVPDPASELVKVRIRVVSGLRGDLIGLLEVTRQIGTRVEASDFEILLAGDSNADGVLNIADVTAASLVLTTDAALSPTVDCKSDGALTMEDLAEVIVRVIEEPQAQRVERHSMALRNLEVMEPIAPPGSGIDPTQMGGGGGGGGGCVVQWQGGRCWYGLGGLIIDFGWLMAAMAGCTGAHAPVCVLARICHLARFLSELLWFADTCLTSGHCLPVWLEHVAGFIFIIGGICQGIELLTDGLKNSIIDWLRRIGRGLGDIRTMI